MVLNDKTISKLATEKDMIVPFISSSVNRVNGEDGYKVLSFGTSSYGYDVRLSREIKIFTNINGCVVDPKCLDHKTLIDAEVTESSTGGVHCSPAEQLLAWPDDGVFQNPKRRTRHRCWKVYLGKGRCLDQRNADRARF